MIARLPLAVLAVALAAATAAAQPPPVQTPPPQTPPAQPAAQAAQPAFPEGVEIGVIYAQRVLDESVEGKAIAAKLQALQQKKLAELTEKNKGYEAAQAKVNQVGATSDQKLAAQKEVDRLQVEIQRMQQDAQSELEDTRNQSYREFEKKLGPVVQQLFTERKLRMIISREANGLLWVDPAIDLTAEVIKRFDAAVAAAKPAGPPKPPGIE